MAVKTWTSTIGDGWDNAGNWSSDTAPASTDDIVIPGGTSHEPVIRSTNNVNISSLTLNNGGSLAFATSGAKLTLNGTGTSKGLTNATGATIALANNTIDVTSLTGGAIVNAGSITMSGGTLSDLNAGIGNSGTITSSSGTSVLASGAAGTSNSGTLSVTAGTLQVTGTGGLTNSSTGLVNVATTLQIAAGALSNNGQISINGGTLQEAGTGIANAGTITTAGTSTIAASAGTNVTGTLAVNNGDLTVTGVLTDAAGGHITLGSSATLTDANGITMSGGTINGFGTLGANTNITGFGTVAISISNAGTITASDGTLDLTGTVSGRTLAISTTPKSDLMIDGTATTSAAIAITNTNQILEVGALGHLTIAAESITNGTIKLDGGILDGGALTIGSGGNLTGSGTVNNAINAINGTGGTITANGVLNLTGTVASGQSFAIGTASASTLLFSGTATASNPISITDSHQTLEIGALGNLTINGAETITNGTIKLDGSTLVDSAGLTVGSGGTLKGSGTGPNDITMAGGTVSQSGGVLNALFITGFGTVNGVTGTAPAGANQIVASNSTGLITGTLDLTGTVSGAQLVVDPNKAGSVLKIDGIVTAGGTSGSIDLHSANQTVEIGATGTLTLPSSETMSNGTIKLDGGTLNATGGLIGTNTTSSGVVGIGVTLIGKGTVNGAISGSGVVEGQGGVLTVSNNVTSSTILLEADSGSTLSLGGTVGTSTSFTYLNNSDFSGTLLLANSPAMGSFETNGVIHGMHEATGLGVVTPTDVLDLRSVLFSSSYATDIVGGNTIQLWRDVGHSSLLASFHLSAPVATGTFVDWQADSAGGTNLFLDDDPCYVAGTHILTATGERTVESLMQGDIVLTLAGGGLSARPVKWIGTRRIDLTAHPRPETATPIRIRRGAFADNMPHRDLLVSPDHAVFVDGKLICARQLVNGATICAETGRAAVEYFHVELDAHAILLAEGLPAESYLNTGNHGFFINSGEPLVLHPDMTDETDYPTREAASCAPFVSDEASVRPVWQRLAERAAALGQPAPKLDTTSDPELRIVAKGRAVRPLYGENGLYIFALPKGAAEVRLVSRAGSPTDARPWLDDRRCLGVNVERIVLRGASELREVPVDHPGLSRGWHAVERDGVALRRWTTGDAVLPLPALTGPTMLEIRASNGGMAYLADAEQEQRAA